MNMRPAFVQSVFDEAARAALAAIDLDPASTPRANAVVQARQFWEGDEARLREAGQQPQESSTWRVVLERLPEAIEEMRFRLVLRGHVPSDKRGTVTVKHQIRRELHPQLRVLWQQHGLLRQAWKKRKDRNGEEEIPIQSVADNYARCGFRFVPLVRTGMACSLDVLMLRRDEPHRVFSGSGDLDGRVKTLLDGLRMPQQCNEIEGHAPDEDENPFFCLLEDDRHIFDLSVTTDRLLVPPDTGEPERDVVAVISVYVRLALGADFAVGGHLKARKSEPTSAGVFVLWSS